MPGLAATLELAVKQALEELAPDLEGMDVEGVVEAEPAEAMPGLELPMAGAGERCAACRPGSTSRAPAGSRPSSCSPPRWPASALVIANVEGTLLAYRNECASCGGSLDSGELSSGALVCPSCGRSYFLPRAGRSLDDERLQLAPVPLLRENGSVRVALAS